MSRRSAPTDVGGYDVHEISGLKAAGLALGALVWAVSWGEAATGTIQDVHHVVILMLENRSFDNHYGCLQGVRGFNDRNALLFQNGNSDLYQPQSNSYVLPFPPTNQCLVDVAHDWYSTHLVWHTGKWDQWVPVVGTTTMAYYMRADLEFFYALAQAYTICDAYFCSVLGPTNPNRLHLWTGMIDPNGTGGGPVTDNTVPAGGFTWTTYPERLQAAGVSWKVYQQSNDAYAGNALAWFAQYKNAQPGNPLYDCGLVQVSNLVAAFQADVTNGTLPRVCWLVPPLGFSEHPPASPANGAVLTQQLLNALASNPAVYNSTVFMLTYDENGGFFDHIPPPVPPPGTTNEFVNGWPIGLGVRVPMLLISPWTRGGYVCSQVFDHTSILRFLEAWTGVAEPNISAWRRQVCGDLTSAFNFTSPDTNYLNWPILDPLLCPSVVIPAVPSPQAIPVQEAGASPARPLPYQPDATSAIDCATGRFYITMTNAGAASIHLAIYPNAYRTDGPWQHDVAAGTSLSDSFDVVTQGGGLYDLTCYGPNGFQRRFAGNLNTNCNQIEVTSSLDLNAGAITLALQNLTLGPVTFTLTNGYQTGGTQAYAAPASTTVTATFFAVTNNSGWYDLAVTASSDTSFLRRFAGHIETWSPLLVAQYSAGDLLLSYPSWAFSYALESTTNLAPCLWAPVNTAPTIVSNKTVVTLPITGQSQYFRLRH